MRKPIKLQPRKYVLNPVQRDARPMRGETLWGQPTAAVDQRYESYRIALNANIERRRTRLYRRATLTAPFGQPDPKKVERLDKDHAHCLQTINYHHKQASAPRVLAAA